MKKQTLTLALLFISLFTFSQTELASPTGINMGDAPEFGSPYKAPGDSCGAYFNDHVALNKSSSIVVEFLADDPTGSYYMGRAQRYPVPQPMEVSGLKFYSYFTDPSVDSVRVFTYLWDWDDATDSIGTMLATDTVWVTYTAYTPVLPDIETISTFDTPVEVTDEYLVGVIVDTLGGDDNTLQIYRNTNPDGAGEGRGYAFYGSPIFGPSFIGWYNFADFGGPGGGYDIDYMISPEVKYDLHDGFNVIGDTICPGDVSATCADYTQMPVFSDPYYNAYAGSPESSIVYYWGDGLQNTGLPSACHTYDTSGTYVLNLQDTLVRHNFFSPFCIVDLSMNIVALDSPNASFDVTNTGLTADFTNTSTTTDSVVYDFGDGSPTVNENDPSHTYSTVGTYTVTMIAYNMCATDTATMEVTVDDVGWLDNNQNFKVYPNPANQKLIIDQVEEGSTIELLNLLGQTIYTSRVTSYKEIIDVSLYKEGAYFVRISGTHDQYTRKILIKH